MMRQTNISRLSTNQTSRSHKKTSRCFEPPGNQSQCCAEPAGASSPFQLGTSLVRRFINHARLCTRALNVANGVQGYIRAPRLQEPPTLLLRINEHFKEAP